MRKFIVIFSIFLFILLPLNPTISTAEVNQSAKFSEGFYNIKDIGLMENISYNVQNLSAYKTFFLTIDSDQKIQQLLSLEPHSQKYPLKPIKNGDRIIIIGKGALIFSTQHC